jgi:uncharacterized protein YfaS (alpha-2-macroglobulin family)
MLRMFGFALVVGLGLLAPVRAETPIPPPAGEASRPFDIAGMEVLAERDAPQVCFTFSDRLEKTGRYDYAAFIEVTPAVRVTAVARDRSLCVDGLAHGASYAVTLAENLPGARGARLAAPARFDVAVPDRKSALAFRGAGYILPRIGSEGLPLRTINVSRARLQVLRINDRGLVEQIYYGRMTQKLSEPEVGGIVERSGEQVWQGDMAIGKQPNQAVVTPFPVDAVLGTLKPGVYVAVAGNADRESEGWDAKATQWFVVSDLGMTSFIGEDGLLVFARSLASAAPAAGVKLRLMARGNTELGQAETGPDGIARFAAAALRGTGAAAPQAVFAEASSGDFSFLDLSGVEFARINLPEATRNRAGPLDAYLFPERGIYRPGESVALTALLRDARAAAVAGVPLTLKLLRPDGFEVERRQVADAGAGGYATLIDLPRGALAGSWSVTAHLDPDGPPIGRADFMVEEFQSPRLEFNLTADRDRIGPDGAATLRIDGRYQFGTPTDDLPGELELTLRKADQPYPRHAGYRFGLAQEDFAPTRADLPGFTTDKSGAATVDLRLADLPETTQPLEAVIRANLFDIGGHAVTREIVLPVRHQPFAIGIHPQFDGDAVPEGATVAFDVIAVAPDGTPVDKPALSYELYEEEHDYRWYEAEGRWDYQTVVKDRRLTGGTLAVAAGQPATVEQPVGSGRYRLEVFDPETGVATSTRFSAGWWVTPTTADSPDKVYMVVMLPKYTGGEVARIFVQPPYESQMLIAVADRGVTRAFTQAIGPDGAFLEIPVDPDWTAGAHVVATAFAPADPVHKTLPRRAMGVAWLAVDPAPRTLDVSVTVPADAAPRRTVSVPVKVGGAEEGAPVRLTLMAVDENVLRLTDQRAPDPADHYLGRRRLDIEVRDIYGRRTDPAGEDASASAGGADTIRRRQRGRVPPRTDRTAAVYSGIVTAGPDGTAEIPLDLPDFNGRLRLMAVAWTPGKVGHAEAAMTLRDPVLVTPTLPRFLAPGDTAGIVLALENRTGAVGDYHIRATVTGPLALDNGEAVLSGLEMGRRGAAGFTLTGTGAGTGQVRFEITGPDGFSLVRETSIAVRPPEAIMIRRTATTLDPGRSVASELPDAAGLRPETVTLSLALNPLPEFDVPGLLAELDRYPFASAEQMASRALPLIALNSAAGGLGLGSEDALKGRVQRTLDRLMSFQRNDGGFALWSSQGAAEPWLTAYAVDVLTRARDAGYRIPDVPYRRAVEWLTGMLNNSWFDEVELPARAYACYALARAKAIDIGPINYFYETWWPNLSTRLARAQVAGAFARLGDTARATEAFNQVERPRTELAGFRDFGSELRDRAGALAIMADSGVVGRDRLLGLAQQIAAQRAEYPRTSTQEQAWLLLAAHNLMGKAGEVKATIDGTPVTANRPIYRGIEAGRAVTVENTGGATVNELVTLTGVPAAALPAEANGFRLERTILDLDGRPVDPGRIRRNQMLVVILEGESLKRGDHQALVVDPLPAGLEIENVRVASSAQLGNLSWLGDLSKANHVDYRDDRFVAEVDLTPAAPGFRLVYLVRAVTPGDYTLPGARVEDSLRPSLFARGPAGRLSVVPDF